MVMAVVVMTVLGCDSRTPEASDSAEPWTLVNYAGPTEGPRVLIIHDMEGLSGQDDTDSFLYGTEMYPRGQELLAADINAVVEGLYAGGASEVLIADGHGSLNPAPDLRADLLDPRATQIIRDEEFDTYIDLPESEDIDAVAVVGMHAKTGSEGFASHTFTLGIELRVHGLAITETELVALSWGRVGVPVIFASGDDRLAADLSTMPWIEYVTVKEAIAADSVRLRPVVDARADLTAGAKRAVERLGDAQVMRVGTPVRASVHAVPPASFAALDGIPGIDYDAQTLSFVTPDLRAAYDGMVAGVGLATLAYRGVFMETALERGDGSDIMNEFLSNLLRRWFDQESGRLSSGKLEEAPSSGQQYHGSR